MALYAGTIFLGAFLLFQVQPIIARYILPWYGGSPAVWTTCVLFFQVLLLGGYLYAHLVGTRLAMRRQAAAHLGLLVLSLAFLPITPGAGWRPLDPTSPTLDIIVLLSATVGLPYLVVAASSPLLQHWFARSEPGRSPYRLFALSNAGSLLGLLTYPFALEPLLSTGLQTRLWSLGFGLYVLCCGLCALRVSRVGSRAAPAPPVPSALAVAPRDRVLWLLLSACGSLMLLATTGQMTQDVAVVPFLWVLPLGLYLVTFIICFDHARWYDRRAWVPLWVLSLGAVVYMLWSDDLTLVQQVGVYGVTVFTSCMVCHGELVRLRPAPAHLTSFYLTVAGGGALGGVFTSLVAPTVFTGFWEFQIGLLCTCVLLALCTALDRPTPRFAFVSTAAWGLGIGALGFFFTTAVRDDAEGMIAATRNFYGLLRVYDKDIGETRPEPLRSLYHGEILHGSQLLALSRRDEALTYYGRGSGVALAIAHHSGRDAQGTPAERGLRIGVVGLGAGTIAALGQVGDTVRFYEINPEVERIANEYFYFLRDARATIDVVLGDGRMSLERELRQDRVEPFDVLVLDAFSGDAVPAHLLTREATQLYWQHLREDGVLVVHVSNKYLNLRPIVRAAAEVFEKRFLLITTNSSGEEHVGASWVVVTSNRVLLDRLAPHATRWPREEPQSVLWTDDYSSLLRVLD